MGEMSPDLSPHLCAPNHLKLSVGEKAVNKHEGSHMLPISVILGVCTEVRRD